MREILFKAKRLDNGEWVEGLLTVMWGQYHIINPKDENTAYPIDPDTICQYTGLTDKAKNRVFENSIIKLIPENVFGVVRFGEYKSPFDSAETTHIGFYVEWEESDRCKFWRKDLGYWLAATTIICGNIFDNPDLMER